MTKYDKALQTGTKEYKEATTPAPQVKPLEKRPPRDASDKKRGK
jgi:hypothetical protein